MKNILIVEDDQLILNYLTNLASPFGRILQANCSKIATQILQTSPIDYVLVDLDLNGIEKEGLNIIKLCHNKKIPCAALTSHSDQETITECFQSGAQSYFTKETVEEYLISHLETISSHQHDSFFTHHYQTTCEMTKKEIIKLIATFKNYTINNLVTGETGIGKTYLINQIHNYLNIKAPLVCKNMREVAPQLVESELFGHVKGAFTGAKENREGLLSRAHKGTLFLDEIGVLPLAIQEKLLTVIETKSFTPVGSNKSIQVDFKLITATCDDLKTKVEKGDMRIDFYHRILGQKTHLAPLRERTNDIKIHVDKIIKNSPKKIIFSQKAMSDILNYTWPGNLRELYSYTRSIIATEYGMVSETNLNHGESENDIQIKSCLSENGLPDLIRSIEQKAFAMAKSKHGEKVNRIIEELKISKSVFYRLQKEMS